MDSPYREGDRVRAVIYGEERRGTVTADRCWGVTWVLWDGRVSPSWVHTDTLRRDTAPKAPAHA